jgi:hypothetical protein
LAGNDIRINESIGNNPPLNGTEMYEELKIFLMESLRKGV